MERVKTVALEKVEKFKKYPDRDSFVENILLVFDVGPRTGAARSLDSGAFVRNIGIRKHSEYVSLLAIRRQPPALARCGGQNLEPTMRALS